MTGFALMNACLNPPGQCRLLTALLEFTSAFVMLQDADSRAIVMVNTNMEILLGRSRAKLLGKGVHEVFDDRCGESLTRIADQVLRNRHLLEDDAMPLAGVDGHPRPFRCRVLPILDDRGRIQYLLSIAEDVAALFSTDGEV
jgi:PAS domain S-box-containing protein